LPSTLSILISHLTDKNPLLNLLALHLRAVALAQAEHRLKVYVGVEDGAWHASDVGLLHMAHVFQKAGVDLAVRVLSEKSISSAWRTLAADATADGKVKHRSSMYLPLLPISVDA
jgi:hypothetical protein